MVLSLSLDVSNIINLRLTMKQLNGNNPVPRQFENIVSVERCYLLLPSDCNEMTTIVQSQDAEYAMDNGDAL